MSNLTPEEVVKDLKSLGNQHTEYLTEPSLEILETFPAPKGEFTVEFVQAHNEFSSLCPKTGQPDSATFKIFYSPDKKCIESKSLKLYLFSYRNTKGFGESITNKVADDLQRVLQAKWLVVLGSFSPRGGIGWNTKAIRLGLFDNGIKFQPIQPSQVDLQMIANYK